MVSSVLYKKWGLICASSAVISASFCLADTIFTSSTSLFICPIILLNWSVIVSISDGIFLSLRTLTAKSPAPAFFMAATIFFIDPVI